MFLYVHGIRKHGDVCFNRKYVRLFVKPYIKINGGLALGDDVSVRGYLLGFIVDVYCVYASRETLPDNGSPYGQRSAVYDGTGCDKVAIATQKIPRTDERARKDDKKQEVGQVFSTHF